jgi:hypothetical protein
VITKSRLAYLILLSLSCGISAHIIDMNNKAEFSSAPKPIPKNTYSEVTRSKYKAGLTRHIVLFDLKESVTPKEKEEIIKRFLALRSSTRDGKPYIKDIEVGRSNISREGVGKGYDLAFIVSFSSLGDLNYYVGQPAIDDPNYYDAMHQSFKDFVGPFLKVGKNPDGSDNVGVLVFDYQ